MKPSGSQSQPVPIRILMYHHVGPFERPERQLGLYCHFDQFARQMQSLVQARLDVISLDQAVSALQGHEHLVRPGIVLTFDDALQNFHDYAWPVLRRYALPATVFAVSDLVGDRARWMHNPLPGSDRLMDNATLRYLARQGVTIGAHSATHPHLSQLDHDQRDSQIRHVKQDLEDMLGQEIRHFAYPFGDYDEDICDRVRRAGFVSAVATQRARADQAGDIYKLPREGISYKDGAMRFFHKTRLRHGWR